MDGYGTFLLPALFFPMPYPSNLQPELSRLTPEAQEYITSLQSDSQQLRQLLPEDPGEDKRLLFLLGLCVATFAANEMDSPARAHRIDLLTGFYERVGETTYFVTNNQHPHG